MRTPWRILCGRQSVRLSAGERRGASGRGAIAPPRRPSPLYLFIQYITVNRDKNPIDPLGPLSIGWAVSFPIEVARAQGHHGIKGGRPRLDLTDEERRERRRAQQLAYRPLKGRAPGLGPGGKEYVRIWGKRPGEPLTSEEFAKGELLWNAKVEASLAKQAARARAPRAPVAGRTVPGVTLFPRVAPSPLAAVVGRNEPCPCGSGRKFKKCCSPECANSGMVQQGQNRIYS